MIPDDTRSRDHRGVTWERRLARSTRSYIGTALERAVEEHSSCLIKIQHSLFLVEFSLINNFVKELSTLSKL